MGLTVGGITYRRARTPQQSAADAETARRLRDAELGITDPVLDRHAAMELIFGETVRREDGTTSYDRWKRLTTEGARVGGKVIVLGTVARPGGRRCLKSQVIKFIDEYERASAARSEARSAECRVLSAEAEARRGLRLVGGGASGRAGGVGYAGNGGGSQDGERGVGRRLDVQAYRAPVCARGPRLVAGGESERAVPGRRCPGRL